MTDRDEPVARPTLSEGDLFVFSEEDLADASAEMVVWLREIPGLTDAHAEEAATMMFEILTDGWADTLSDDLNDD